MDEDLAEIDKLLSDEKLFQLLKADLSQRYPQTTKTGRNSTPVEVILRILVLKHLRSLSYERRLETSRRASFCGNFAVSI
jgi:IS5 family transposase